MAQYKEKYLLNSSELQTTVINKQTIVNNIKLTSINTVSLKIEGYIWSSSIGQGIPNALLVLYDPTGLPVASTITLDGHDSDKGVYHLIFDGNKNITYKLVISKQGFHDTVSYIEFKTNNKFASFDFHPDNTTNIIYGTVTDASGNPLQGARIAVSNPLGDTVVRTDEHGKFLASEYFPEIKDYPVTATLLGYSPASTVVTTTSEKGYYATNFVLPIEDEIFTNIHGKIIHAVTGLAIAGATVGLFRLNGQIPELIKTTKTNDDGRYSFSGVSSNVTYIIKAEKSELL